jgi:hypothetical protein
MASFANVRRWPERHSITPQPAEQFGKEKQNLRLYRF